MNVKYITDIILKRGRDYGCNMRKIAGSIPDEVIFLNLPNPSGPGVYSASNRNEYQKHKNNSVSGK
jgi:hypothetical protein